MRALATLIQSLSRWRARRIAARHPIDAAVWRDIVALPLFHGLNPDELEQLGAMCAVFMHDKRITGAGGQGVSDAMRLLIAAHACLMALNLGLPRLRGWVEVVVYPDQFLRPQEVHDEAGVVHVSRDVLSGEAWPGGPVILSWADTEHAGRELNGVNVVLHEFAHKLDMARGGEANGFPPLHADMRARDWAAAFKPAFEDFSARVARGEDTWIDPYAAESPAEFFAVLSEVFFEAPDVLSETYPEVYARMRDFYRQDPLPRLAPLLEQLE
jgi:Mlc titration factor MtfA (ptsG expression regulator)